MIHLEVGDRYSLQPDGSWVVTPHVPWKPGDGGYFVSERPREQAITLKARNMGFSRTIAYTAIRAHWITVGEHPGRACLTPGAHPPAPPAERL